jgi:anti-sigma factor RsiW
VARPTDVLTCYLTRRRLGALLDGALSEHDAREAEQHVNGCARCQREAAELRRVKVLVAEAIAVPEPDWTGFWPGVVRGIQDSRDRASVASVRPARWLWPQWAIGGAAVAGLAVALVLWQGGRGPVPAEASVVVNSAETEQPGGTVMVYSSPERDIAVVWVFDTDDAR